MSGSVDATRRALLRGRLRPPPGAVRPPWALDESAFVDACSGCGDCVGACPESILRIGDGGYPEVNFSAGGCTFCGDCVEACPEPAFRFHRDGPPWRHAVTIDSGCLAHRGVFCMSCRDACDAGAIAFERRGGTMPAPALDPGRCTGCGTCICTCPADAISLVHDHERARYA